ncbi:MAG TPA: cytochrome c [Bryobacteraceae bacterium]|jgi:quinoprotein glucose dehydrogenase|nr:cytochrome c [Bryobacteraceae bacterium]
MKRGGLVLVSVGLVVAATAWGLSASDGVFSAAQAERGKNYYAGACASCHGRELDGGHIYGSRTRSAPGLRGDAFLSKWTGLTAGELFTRISTSMPLDHPGSLSDEENTDVVSFILLSNGFPTGARELPADVAVMNTIQIDAKKK